MKAIVAALLVTGYCILYGYFNLLKRLTGSNTSMIYEQASAKVVYVHITLGFVWSLYAGQRGENERQWAVGSGVLAKGKRQRKSANVNRQSA